MTSQASSSESSALVELIQRKNKIDQNKSKIDQRESKIDQLKSKIDQRESKIDQIESKMDRVLLRTLVRGHRSCMWIPFPWN